jgi:hypothetical protein
MKYTPKHLSKPFKGKKKPTRIRISVATVLIVGIVGLLIYFGILCSRIVPGETVSNAQITPSALSTPSEDVPVATESSSTPTPSITPSPTPSATSTHTSIPTVTPTPEVSKPITEVESTQSYTDEDLTAMVKTLAGECYDYEIQDKYNVAWTIINRVRNGGFGGNTVLQVVSSPSQFYGYWHQARAISDSDYAVAKDVLTAYYAGEDAPVDYLYFSSSGGTTNIFR